MNFKKEFIVAFLLEPRKIGDRFTMWPLHSTVLPWFEAPGADAVKAALMPKLTKVSAVKTRATKRENLGPRKQPVMLLENTSELQRLHEAVLSAVQENGWPIRGRYTGELFKPHVTQKMGKDAEGEIIIDKLSIVESQTQGYREIVGEISL